MLSYRLFGSRVALVMASLFVMMLAATSAGAAEAPDMDAAREYCASAGGQVQERQAM